MVTLLISIFWWFILSVLLIVFSVVNIATLLKKHLALSIFLFILFCLLFYFNSLHFLYG
jgi:hypothetical protein